MEYIKPYWDPIVAFFNHPFFIVIGGVATLAMVAGAIYTLSLIIKRVIPVWYRLGVGLSKRKIAIFATTEYQSLKNMLVDSKIFTEENIIQIHTNDLRKAEKESVFLVHWKDYQDVMPQILDLKRDSTALIVYAPQSEGRIENQTILDNINLQRNSIIVNFRGRLLNDILVSLITTSYER